MVANVLSRPLSDMVAQRMDLSSYSSKNPSVTLNLLFIHHSCGATLLSDPGEKNGEYCLYDTHPNGGGLRNLLKSNNYNVHEATYGSKVGQNTDINHWQAKFRKQMDLVLKVKFQDTLLKGDETNQIIIFKSCYPNNMIVADGESPGDPNSSARTLWNCKAAYMSLLPVFEEYSDTLFIALSAPPVIKPWMNKYKERVLTLVGRGPDKISQRARKFNNWLADDHSGWLSSYRLNNVVVFDLFNILTNNGICNWTQYPSGNGKDSHPNQQGNMIVADQLCDFINRAVRYAGLVPSKS